MYLRAGFPDSWLRPILVSRYLLLFSECPKYHEPHIDEIRERGFDRDRVVPIAH